MMNIHAWENKKSNKISNPKYPNKEGAKRKVRRRERSKCGHCQKYRDKKKMLRLNGTHSPGRNPAKKRNTMQDHGMRKVVDRKYLKWKLMEA